MEINQAAPKFQDVSIAPMHTAEHLLNATMVKTFGCLRSRNAHIVQSPNQKIPDRKTKCVIKTHINIKQNVIFGAKLKPV